jgi:hypothetical protein
VIPELAKHIQPLLDNPTFEEKEYPFLNGPATQVKRRTVDAVVRRRILERDGNQCQVCWAVDRPLEIDHKIPVCRGGTHDDGNLWVLCDQCNHVKADFTVAEFQFFILRITGCYLPMGDEQ